MHIRKENGHRVIQLFDEKLLRQELQLADQIVVEEFLQRRRHVNINQFTLHLTQLHLGVLKVVAHGALVALEALATRVLHALERFHVTVLELTKALALVELVLGLLFARREIATDGRPCGGAPWLGRWLLGVFPFRP